jgi:septal ring factor EnvC (AmiA/AmiB activator)
MFACSKRIFISLVLVLALSFTLAAQRKSKAQLQTEKTQSLLKIKQAEKILAQTKQKKKTSVGQLYAVQEQIKERQKLTSSIRETLTLIGDDIEDNNDIIEALEDDLKNLKKEYAEMVYNTQKASQSQSKLLFLFSAKTFNQLFMRMKYMEQYAETRKKQSEQINKVKKVLGGQVTSLKHQKNEKNDLLAEQLNESDKIQKLQVVQKSVISALAKTETQAKKNINKNKKSIGKLNKLIDDIIKAEIAKSTKSKSATKLKLTPKSAALAKSFTSNKGKLPWPVESGFITQRYGKQTHPVWKHVTIDNPGIDIQTEDNQKVRSVFEGQVKKIAFVPGMGNMVMIQHGEYFTVYAKLKEVHVRSGQSISTKDTIGTALTDSDGVTELKFSVWKNNQTMNPKLWLYPR